MYLISENKLKNEGLSGGGVRGGGCWPGSETLIGHGDDSKEYVLYHAVGAYMPHGNGEIALQPEDLLEISSKTDNNGWLMGFNRRTGATGYIHGKFHYSI